MKGISHFISGVAAASFFPWAVQGAAEGNPLYFILGGAFGVLPDTIDFKFYRFFFRHDVYIEPDPAKIDPQAIADALAGAVAQALQTRKVTRAKLSTIRLGADYWQQYMLRFDVERQEVQVRLGPVVNTGQVPVPGTEAKEGVVGRAKLPCPIIQTYEAVTTVDIFDGPTFAFEADEKGKVIIHFLPWHRQWSHSLLFGCILGALFGLFLGWRAAVVIPMAYAAHILEDQLGFMGSNLFWPLTRRRFPGLHTMHAGDAWPNFATVWTCCLLIFWNIYRQMDNPLYHFTFMQLALYGAVIPLGAYALAHWWLTRDQMAEKEEIDLSQEWGDTMVS